MPTPRKRGTPAATTPDTDSVVRFKLEGKSYEIDPKHLEWGEIESLELYFDKAYDAIDFDSMRAVMFLAYLSRKRVEPDFTIEAMRHLKLSDLEDDTTPRPTDSGAVDTGTP
jgi:hypothetical protein